MFSKILALGNCKNEIRKETDIDSKTRGETMERSKAGTKKISPDGLSQPIQNTIIINIIW